MARTNQGEVKNLRTGPCWAFFNNRPLGYTNGGISIKAGSEKTELEVDQETDPVLTTSSKRTIDVTVPLAEMTLENLSLVFSGSEIKGTYPNEYLVVGTGGAKTTGSLRLHPIDRDDDDFTEDYFFGNSSPAEDAEIPINKGEIRTASVSFTVSPDSNGEVMYYKEVPAWAKVPLGALAFSSATLSLSAGEERTLRVLYTPSNAFDRNVTATSSNENVAIVQKAKNGYIDILAISAGTTTITIDGANGASADCDVTVA